MDSNSSISDMSPKVKAGVAVVASGGILGLISWLFSDYLWVIIIGAVLVGIALGIYAYFIRRANKKKAKGFASEVSRGTGGNVGGVNDPKKIADLDNLHKKFLEGIRTFEARGKDLYSIPWYLIVGEPGSGKTEAIRHCDVGFPPGLGDSQAGTGGTINMDWWYTNEAVLLDTAGRLLFEEVDATSTSEWDTFLRMLAKHRPNCPINGLLLVIPADSLIKDSADEISRKGGRIAQQLDKIQGVLGVRFPVFLVITKCDLINGCREFFENLEENVERQHQMMGWSNPAELDESFDPTVVERHLDQVAQRLQRRRLGMLLDPVNTESPDDARLNEVDDLFAFPDSLKRIGPRLKRYLELIFVAGTWSRMPLFLRGIYFTSSLQEGKALDADLAEALGISVESLETKVWEKSHAFFLRDLFQKKVFRERGLVTRATNTRSLKRRRKMVLLGTGFAAVLLMAVLTWLGASTLEARMGKASKDWPIAAKFTGTWPIVAIESFVPKYTGGGKMDGTVQVGEFYADALNQIEDPTRRIEVPGIFRIWPTADLNGLREDAFRAWVEVNMLRPTADAAVTVLQVDKTLWTDPNRRQHAVAALEQLLRIEMYRQEGVALKDTPPITITPLLRLVLADDKDFKSYEQNEKETFERVVAWSQKSATESGESRWQMDPLRQRRVASVMAGLKEEDQKRFTAAIQQSTDQFAAHWAKQVSLSAAATTSVSDKDKSILVSIKKLETALADYRNKETELLDAMQRVEKPIDARGDAERVIIAWREKYRALATGPGPGQPGAYAALQDAVKEVEEAAKFNLAEKNQFGELEKKIKDEVLKPALTEYDRLQRTIRPVEAMDEASLAAMPVLHATHGKLTGGQTSLKNAIDDALSALNKEWNNYQQQMLRASTIRSTAGEAQSIFTVRFNMYTAASKTLPESTPLTGEFTADFVKTSHSALTELMSTARKLVLAGNQSLPPRIDGAPPDASDRAGTLVPLMVDLCEKVRKHDLADAVLTAAPVQVDAWETVAVINADAVGNLDRPVIPLTRDFAEEGKFELKFAPARMKAMSAILTTAGTWAKESMPSETLVAKQDKIQASYGQFLKAYQEYWGTTVPDGARFDGADKWPDLLKEMDVLSVDKVNPKLKELTSVQVKALEAIAPSDPATPTSDDLTRLRKQFTQFTPALNEACNKMISAWDRVDSSSNPDSNAAIDRLLRMTAREFSSQYLLSSWDEAPGYWRQLASHHLIVLGTEGKEQANFAIGHLLSTDKGARFPVIRDADPANALSGEEVAFAYQLIRKLDLRGEDATSQDYPPETMGSGETAFLAGFKAEGNQTIADLVKLLKGGKIASDGQVKVLARMKTVLASLCVPNVGPDSKTVPFIAQLKCKVVPPSPDGFKNSRSDVSFKVGNTTNDVGAYTGNEKYAFELTLPNRQVQFIYYSDPERKSQAGSWSPRSEWSLLELVLQNSGDDSKTQDVQITFTDKDGKAIELKHWIRLEFAKPLPKLDQWPGKDEVGRAR